MNQQEIDICDGWINLVKKVFPNHAEFKTLFASGDYICEINWKLNNDANRPNKRSKTIAVKIPKEVLEDCQNPQKAQKRFMEFIVAEYTKFDPDHNAKPPPIEEWLVTNNFLNA